MTYDIEFEKLCKRFLQIVEDGIGLPGGGIPIGPLNDPTYIQDLRIDANEFEKILKYIKEKNYVDPSTLDNSGLIPRPSDLNISEVIKITESGRKFLNT